jgi:hypothetical protein
MKRGRFSIVWLAGAWLAAACRAAAPASFEIDVLDAGTGRGIPLVELETTHHTRWVTDNAGRIAFDEAGLLGRRVFFFVQSPGYESPRDGFGMEGLALATEPGGKAEIRLRRTQIAERLYRVTGAGLYRDSLLLGHSAPLREPLLNAGVLGQDSAQAAAYRGRIHWFWGDTTRSEYPLGNFLTTGAVSDPPGQGGLAPSVGVDLRYETGTNGFARPMAPDFGEGMVWVDGLCVVPDAQERPHLIVHYARMKSLEMRLGHGIAEYDDETRSLRKVREIADTETWRYPGGQAEIRDGHVYFAAPYPFVRAPARFEALLDPASYEAYAEGPSETPAWQREEGPMKKTVADAATREAVSLHAGSARWNDHRRRWILVGNRLGGKESYLGEVWYSEAPAPEGPWTKAIQIATHPKYSFYNPVHHGFFDEEGGRTIYFEGTYAATFSGNEFPTARYDYNQIMYRLRLDDPRLTEVFGKAPADGTK